MISERVPEWTGILYSLLNKKMILILTEESYINKESEKQLRSRYDHFISSVHYVAVVSSQFSSIEGSFVREFIRSKPKVSS